MTSSAARLIAAAVAVCAIGAFGAANAAENRHVEIDNQTGQRMYPMKAVREWHARRPGRGNWGGIGAQARVPKEDQEQEPTGPAVDGEPVAALSA